MVSRLPRLTRRQDYQRVARTGRSWAAPGLVLQCAPAGGCEAGPRVGFTASRRIGGAVARNRARRRLRAAAEELLPRLARADRDYVLIARATTNARRFDRLLADLAAALAKVGGLRR